MSMAGLRPEQGPPLSIPASFFLNAPLAMVAAGALVMSGGPALLATRFGGSTVALVHLGTLGLLASVMLGALYQMLPVVAGAPVPGVRLAHAVHAGLVAAVVALVLGFARGQRGLVHAGSGLLLVVFLCFLGPVVVALARAPVKGPTVAGMRVAVLGLALVVALGVTLATLRGSGRALPHYAAWLVAHLGFGFVVWIGGLISAVSYQVVPMFYLTPSYPGWAMRAITAAQAIALAGGVACLALGAAPETTALAFAPGALAVFGLHPALTLVAIRRRKRKRPDASLLFWKAGLAVALCLLPAAALALFADDFRFPMLFGWLLVWGFGACIVHGMLGRILPFLVWFHRYSKRAGKEPVPSMRQLLPERYQRVGFWLHLGTLLTGAAAIGTGAAALRWAMGAGLVLTGGSLLVSLVRVLR